LVELVESRSTVTPGSAHVQSSTTTMGLTSTRVGTTMLLLVVAMVMASSPYDRLNYSSTLSLVSQAHLSPWRPLPVLQWVFRHMDADRLLDVESLLKNTRDNGLSNSDDASLHNKVLRLYLIRQSVILLTNLMPGFHYSVAVVFCRSGAPNYVTIDRSAYRRFRLVGLSKSMTLDDLE